jgi:hypothetical protein
VRDEAIICKMPPAYFRRPARDDDMQTPAELRRKFEKEADTISNGSHLGWLAWAAQVYFGLFADSKESLGPRERLVETLGEANAASGRPLSRTDVPTLRSVVEQSVQRRPATGRLWALSPPPKASRARTCAT